VLWARQSASVAGMVSQVMPVSVQLSLVTPKATTLLFWAFWMAAIFTRRRALVTLDGLPAPVANFR